MKVQQNIGHFMEQGSSVGIEYEKVLLYYLLNKHISTNISRRKSAIDAINIFA